MRICRWLLAVLFPFITGCSWMTYFAVVNKTPEPIFIEYRLAGDGTRNSLCPDGHFIMKPKMTDINAINDLNVLAIPEAKFVCEADTRTVRLELPPDKGVFLFEELNYTGFRTEAEIEKQTHIGFQIKSISVQGKFGKVYYENAQVPRDFEKIKRSLYVLTYK